MEIFSISAAIFELLAIYFIGKKKTSGFILGMIGNMLWITFCVLANSSFGLLLVSPVAFALNVKGYINWKKINFNNGN